MAHKKTLLIFYSLFVAIALIGHLSVSRARADDDLHTKTEQVFGSVMSPFCPGRLLRDCPSSQASELKEKIEQRISAGEDPKTVAESLITVYGEEMRAAPKTSGFGIVAWVGPFIFLALGIILAWCWLTRMQNRNAETPASKPLDPQEAARVERELR